MVARKRFVCVICIVFPLSAFAQINGFVKLVEGKMKNFKALREQTSYNLIYSYDSMLVGKDEPEAHYVERKKDDHDTKNPSKPMGTAFEEMWFSSRKTLYEPTFGRNFEKIAKVKTDAPNAKYTLLLKTLRTEGGWTLGVTGKTANLDLELAIFETADNSKLIARIQFLNVNGTKYQGSDFEMAERIQSAYYGAAKTVGDFFRINAK